VLYPFLDGGTTFANLTVSQFSNISEKIGKDSQVPLGILSINYLASSFETFSNGNECCLISALFQIENVFPSTFEWSGPKPAIISASLTLNELTTFLRKIHHSVQLFFFRLDNSTNIAQKK